MQEKFLFNGKYSVTDEGKVYSFTSGTRVEMKQYPFTANRKYRAVGLSIEGKTRMRTVHRLVANAFIPNPENKPQVNHIDGNPANNNVSNLEWCTNSENQIHAYNTGLHKSTECALCGMKNFSKNHRICKNCREKIIAVLEREATEVNRSGEANLAISELNGDISSKRLEMLKLRSKGLSYEEIAKVEGCSKQNVQQSISGYLKRATNN